MSLVAQKKATVVIASGASTSSDLNLSGRTWPHLGVQIGSMSTGANVQIQNSTDGGTTFYTVYNTIVNSSAVQSNPMVISSTVGATGGYILLPQGLYRHVRFLTTAVVSGGVSFTVCFGD